MNPAPTTPSWDSSANKADRRGQWVWPLGLADGLGSQGEEKGNQRYSPGFWTELMVLLPEMGKKQSRNRLGARGIEIKNSIVDY